MVVVVFNDIINVGKGLFYIFLKQYTTLLNIILSSRKIDNILA